MNRFYKQLVFILLTIAIITFGALVIRAVNNRGADPIAHWSFDEGYASTTYDSFGSNDGTLTGGLKWKNEESCKKDKCLFFDGTNDYVSVGNGLKSFGTSGDFTITAWMRGTTAGQSIITYGFGNHTYGRWGLFSSFASVYDNTDPKDYRQVSSMDSLDGSWHFLTGVYDRTNSRIEFYIDGISKGVTSWDGAMEPEGDNRVFIGVLQKDVKEDYFNGFIDDIRLYEYARLADQIKADYLGGGVRVASTQDTNAQSDGLIAHWTFDETALNSCGTNTDACDSSGSNHLTAINDAAPTSTAKYGYAATFDGTGDYYCSDPDDDGVCEDDDDLSPENITLSAWINFSNITTMGVISKRQAHGIDDEYNILYFNSAFRMRIGGENSAGEEAIYTFTPTTNIWYHIVGVFDGTTIQLYLNGSAVGQVGVPGVGITNADEPLYIGALHAGNNIFDGQIDDVKIYNKVRTASQIRKDYETGPSPVSHWKFDERTGTTAYDTSGSNDGFLTSGPIWINGKYGGALDFDGVDDYVDMNDVLDMADMVTISVWVKPDNLDTDYQRIVAKETSGTMYALGLRSTGAVHWYIESTAVDSTAGDIVAGKWSHIATTWNRNDTSGSNAKIYIDGVLVKEGNDSNSLTDNALDFRIGSRSNGTIPFDGSIDDVRIYNYARTQKQIMEDMNAGHPAVDSYVGYWNFDEGYASTSYDKSIHSNDGTLTGGVKWTQNGKSNSAIYLDGSNDYIAISDHDSLDITEAITISSWVKLNPTQVDDDWGKILTKGQDTTYTLQAERNNTENPDMRVWISSTEYNAQATTNIYDNVWHHVVGTYDGAYVRIYVDSVLENQTAATGDIDTTSDDLRIGLNTAGADGITGFVDEVKIYPFALTQKEIKEEYDGGVTMRLGSFSAPPTGGAGAGTSTISASLEYCVPGSTDQCDAPVAHWKMDEMTGSTVYDTAGGNDGDLNLNGSPATSTAWQVAGCHVGSCLSFDGVDDYVDVVTTALPYSVATVSMWLRPGYASGGGKKQYIYSSANTGNNNNRIQLRMVSGNYEVLIYNSGGTLQATLSFAETDMPQNTWGHIVFSWQANNAKLYLNGVLKSTDISVTVPTGVNPLWALGNWVDPSVTYGYNGKIDDVRIYDYARTPAQVAWDYNRGAPVGWWKMDEGQNTATTCDATLGTVYDYSGNGNNGTLNLDASPATSTAWVEGKYGCALDFDGTDDYIVIGNDTSLQITSNLTVSAWIKTSVAENNAIFTKFDDAGVSERAIIFEIDNGGKLRFVLDSTGNWTTYVSLYSNNIVNNNEWHHVVGVYNGATVKVYIDGIENNSASYSSGIYNTPTNAEIGSMSDGSERYFDGKIDDVRIYNYALTELQIKNVYNEGSAVRFGPSLGLQ